MIIDPQTVAQAKAFVNAIRAGKRAHMPAMRFEQWAQFMAAVDASSGYAREADAGLGACIYPALGLA